MARRRDPTDELSDEMIQAYFEALASNPLQGGPAQTLGPEAPPPRNRAEQLVATPSPFVDPGERMLTPGGPPPARPPSLTPSAQPPRSTVFSEAEMTPAVTNALLATPGQREEMQSEFEGLRNLAVTGAVAAPVGRAVDVVGRGAAAVGRAAGNVLARAPRTTAAVTAGGATALGTAETQAPSELDAARQEETRRRTRVTALEEEGGALTARWGLFDNLTEGDTERIKRAQAALNIAQDGRLGPQTRTAIAAERQRITNERTRIDELLGTAREDFGRAETRRQSLEADQRARETRAGPFRQGAREIGPWLAAAIGAYAGHRTRTGAVSRANELTARNVAEANALLTPGPLMPGRSAAARADTLARVGNMTEFWRRGGAGEAVPFVPAQTARGFRARPRAAEAATLFPPDTRRFRGQDWGHIGGGAAEAGLSGIGWVLAQQELAAAQAAVDRERSEINLNRLEQAHDMVALANAFMRAGLGYGVGRGVGGYTHPYSNAQPNIGAAESERMLLNQLLAPASRRRR